MSQHALMKKGEATMNVPPEKVQAYEEDGWKVIQPPAEVAPEADQPIEPKPEIITAKDAAEKIGKTRKGK